MTIQANYKISVAVGSGPEAVKFIERLHKTADKKGLSLSKWIAQVCLKEMDKGGTIETPKA